MTIDSISLTLRRLHLVTVAVVLVLLGGALSIAAATAYGVIDFKDVGYPDSATLLRVGQAIRSGHIYPDIDKPPYLVSLYGPLTYYLLEIPYRLALDGGIEPRILVRLFLAGVLCVCLLLIFLISKVLYGSRSIASLCTLFAVSALPLAYWTVQIRGDLLALAFSLLSVYWFLRTSGRLPQVIGAAVVAGFALLVKQTFVVAPIAVVVWLIFRRRFKEAACWVAGFAFTVLCGFALVRSHEPLMLQHISALRHPVLEFRQAALIVFGALSQPVVIFAAIGGVFALLKRAPEGLFIVLYCVVAWLLAIVTIPQVGGSINYFWEPLVGSALLAGPGLFALQQRANRASMLVIFMLFLLLLRSFFPILREEFRFLAESYAKAIHYQSRKAKWDSFVSIVSGHRLLSTSPEVTIHSTIPEIPDPILNSVLEMRGQWDPRPFVAQIDAGVYDLVVVFRGESESQKESVFRGIHNWNDSMWGALKRQYGRACVFENMEIWLPHRDSGDLLPRLSAIGCQTDAPERAGVFSDRSQQR